MNNDQATNNTLFLNGSIWLRADFHLHTKADKEFQYDGVDNDFISDYIQALSKSGIRVAVITNHNKFDLDEYKALYKAGRKENILVLPGVELSVKDGKSGVHTLVVFKRDWVINQSNTNHIQSFLTTSFSGQSNFKNENARSNHDLLETMRRLNEFNQDYFFVFAHVEATNGLWDGLSGGRIEEFGKNESFKQRCLGFQKVRTHDKRDITKGLLADWYPAEVEGSDCKSLDQIGQNDPCYLKIGDFTFEAVKYALLDYNSRVSAKPEKYESSHIISATFEGGVLDGETIHFSPGLNTLIGIRGSGKSSILEAVRYALDIPFGEKSLDQDYKQSLIGHMLGSGGKVTIQAVDCRGQRYEIRRIYKERPDVYVDGVLHPGVSIRETILQKPIYFGQKDLSSSGEGVEKDLVEKLVWEKLADIRTRIDEQRQKVSEAVAQLKKLTGTDEKKGEFTVKKQDAEERLTFYKKHGVEEKLQKQVDFDKDSRKCAQVLSFVKSYLSDLEGFINQHEDDLKNQRVYKSRQNKEFFDDFFAIYGELVKSLENIKNDLSQGRESLGKLQDKVKQFEKLKDGFKEEFANIERTLAEELKKVPGTNAIRADEFRELRRTVDQSKQMIKALEKQETQQIELNDELLKELATLNTLWNDEYRQTHDKLSKVNENNSSLEIKAEFKADKDAFVSFMKDIFGGSRIRKANFTALTREFADFGDMYKDFDSAKALVGSSSAVFEEYFLDNLSALLTWQVPNRFVIEYRGKELKHHSLGQRASALILFVLSQGENDVIIIDQPEDDLDNQTIYEDVIKLIRSLKPSTQFILATHNANFPVLGDAEQILSCVYSDETITVTSGSIDCPALQQEIVDIMEGGEEAFRQRKRIYEIWKPQSY